MRLLVTFVLRLATVGMLLVASIAFALGQDRSDRAEAGGEWMRLANGRTEFEVSDPALVPSRLARAAEQTGCRYADFIANDPVRFTKIGRQRLAIVPCWSVANSSHQVFDLSTLERPRPIEFPVPAYPEGFGTTLHPGRIDWNKETSIFQAVIGSDMKPSWSARYTYRFDGRGFVVIRVEVQHDPGPEWISLWEAPRWSPPETK